MACSSIVQACLASRRVVSAYAPPEPLEPLHILDLLELTGSQPQAARALAMHQSTVSRSVAMMSEQFRLQAKPRASVCRYGTNDSLKLLRQASRAHRLMDGLLRISADPLHQQLLVGMTSVQAVPPRVRLSSDWARLVEQAVLDGAIVSSWCHPRALRAQRLPSWPGVTTVALGELPLQLVMAQPSSTGEPLRQKVLLPRKSATPLLHETLAWHGFQVEQQPLSCQEVPAWLKRMRDRELAMPICPGLLEPGWLQAQGLIPHPQQPPLRETLWLLLPEGRLLCSHPARHLIRILRQRVEKAEVAWIPCAESASGEIEGDGSHLPKATGQG